MVRSGREGGEEGGRRLAGCAEAAATLAAEVERTSSWPLKQKPVLPRFPLPRWTHRMHRWSTQSRPSPSSPALSGCHSFTGPLCSLRIEPCDSAAQRSAPAHAVKRSGPVVRHRPSAAAWMMRGGGGGGAARTANMVWRPSLKHALLTRVSPLFAPHHPSITPHHTPPFLFIGYATLHSTQKKKGEEWLGGGM